MSAENPFICLSGLDLRPRPLSGKGVKQAKRTTRSKKPQNRRLGYPKGEERSSRRVPANALRPGPVGRKLCKVAVDQVDWRST